MKTWITLAANLPNEKEAEIWGLVPRMESAKSEFTLYMMAFISARRYVKFELAKVVFVFEQTIGPFLKLFWLAIAEVRKIFWFFQIIFLFNQLFQNFIFVPINNAFRNIKTQLSLFLPAPSILFKRKTTDL